MFSSIPNSVFFLKIAAGIFALSYIINGKIIESHPYKSTIYIDPSAVTLKLKNENSWGFGIGLWYIALYINTFKTEHKALTSKLYCLATKHTIKRLESECYYNNFY